MISNRTHILHRKRIIATATAVLALLALTGAADAPSSVATASAAPSESTGPNVMCPVMTDQEAVDDYTIEYRGESVRFCCQECQKEFLRDPEKYETAVAGIAPASLLDQAKSFYEANALWVLSGTLLLALVTLRIMSVFRKNDPAANADPTAGQVSPTIPLLIMLAFVSYQFLVLVQERADAQLEEDLHYATFYDFGFPPVPKRPPTSPRLAASFYRGNDERNPRLFNNGNYRTATFHVALCDEDGTELQAGDSIADQSLFIRFQIERPPFTPDFLYEDSLMSKMFLTAQCETFLGRNGPVPDQVGLTTIEHMQKWEAMFPINAPDCCEPTGGLVYICEVHEHEPWYLPGTSRVSGSRFHYAIQYKLDVVDGRLADTSDLWMGALYRTRKFQQVTVPLDQWFSHEPIPELPGKNVEDPDLLGISDYESR